ncbi:MAG: homocysteine S-methyltransferase family protein [Pseudomonadota bacterium]
MTDIILLDGGMGQELVRRSKDPATPQWSLYVMKHEPELVQELHEEYLRAGATVLTLNTYATTRGRFRRLGDEAEFIPMQHRAIELVEAARDAVGVEASFAGCLPPLAGSYRPELVWEQDEMLAEYREIVEIEAPKVDVFLCETMSTAAEGRAAAIAACESGKPTWVAWTLAEKPAEDGTARLRSGETVAEAIAGIEGLPVAGIMLNCCPPEMMTLAMDDMAADGRPFGGYANGFTPIPDEYVPGTTVDLLGRRTDLGPDSYAQHTMDWVDAGATIVGGCCEVEPAHTAAMAQALTDAGHRLVTA